MKIAVHLARHRRLAGLVVLSFLLHLSGFAWIDGWLASRQPPATGAALALRLVRTPAPTSPQAPQPAESPAAPSRAAPPALAAVPAVPEPLAAPEGVAPAPSAALARSDAPAQPASSLEPGVAPLQMPGRYRVRPPPSTRLTYAVTRMRPGGPAEPAEAADEAADIDWRLERGSYQLRVDGVLGRFESEGADDDAGIAPRRSSERGPAGAEYVTRFDREAQRIEYGAGSVPLHLGSQDRASVLMQLAGIGLADPDQMQGVIDILVGGAGGAQIVRFQVLGQETLATGAGTLAAVRLAQSAQAGERRIELWLAPQRNWLPVQLRVTEPDGTVANQLVTRIEAASTGLANTD